MTDAIFELARQVVRTRYDNLPEEVIARTKLFILDTLAAGLAGSTAAGCAEAVQLVQEQGGRPDGSILVYGGKVPAQEAAFANSMMIHALDFDDSHEGQVGAHCNATVLPSALALAERNGTSGKEFITAVVSGIDLIVQLGSIAPLFDGWHNTATLGVFGAAATAGRLLGLDETTMVNALGIAFSQASGTRQSRADGALTKRMQPAFAAKAGVFSALLAQRGLTGAKNIIEGPWGFFRLYGQDHKHMDSQTLAQWRTDRSNQHAVMELSAKLYPCCRMSHGAIDAALALRHEHGLREKDIAEVTVQTSPAIHEAAGGPFRIRDNPQVDAQFSIAYVIAVAMRNGRVVLDDFEAPVVQQPGVAELARKVHVAADATLPKWTTIVNVRTTDGKCFTKRIDTMKGHPGNPLSGEDLLAKFRSCAHYAVKPLSLQRANDALAFVDNLESQDNINPLMALMV